MTDQPVRLDRRRGMAVKKATEGTRRRSLIASALEDFARLTEPTARSPARRIIDPTAALRVPSRYQPRRRSAVANREQRGNREKRKPKAEKPKLAKTSPFSTTPATGSAKGGSGKKDR